MYARALVCFFIYFVLFCFVDERISFLYSTVDGGLFVFQLERGKQNSKRRLSSPLREPHRFGLSLQELAN